MPNPSSLSLAPRIPAEAAAVADPAIALLGPSVAMAQLWSQVRRLAPYVRTVLLTGAPDAGQQAVARLLLDLSPYPTRAFLAFGRAEAEQHLLKPSALHALPADLVLFVSEVHHLSTAAQGSLLRLLRGRRARASVVAATSEDLRALVSMGKFSAELAHVLGSVRLAVPSLGERTEDLPMLLAQMLAFRSRAAGRPAPQLSEGFVRAAIEHAWPGNLRELSQTVDNLLSATQDGTELEAADLHEALIAHNLLNSPYPDSLPIRMIKLDMIIQEHICAVLSGCGGNKMRAAEVLGISRSTLYRMLESTAENVPLSLAS